MAKNNYLVQRLIAPTVDEEENETLPSQLAPIFEGCGFLYVPAIAEGRPEVEENYNFRRYGVSGSVVQSLTDQKMVQLTIISSKTRNKKQQRAINALLLQLPMFKREEDLKED